MTGLLIICCLMIVFQLFYSAHLTDKISRLEKEVNKQAHFDRRI